MRLLPDQRFAWSALLATPHFHVNLDPLWWVVSLYLGWRLVKWLALIIWLPLGTCWLCKGTGKRWGSTRKRSGNCLLCKGKPERFRRGARLVYRSARKK